MDLDDLIVSVVAVPAIAAPIKDAPECVLCEFVMVKLEKELADKKTEVTTYKFDLQYSMRP